uniref:Chromo domain-containing protein n=1 Tax=Eutreptiella gymnastica TaxID=73025 RepID=A0A7S4G244_9EUGL
MRRGDSGGGLSGGWRGFALRHKLAVGDVVVFEHHKGKMHRIRALIFRALSEAKRKALAADAGDEAASTAAALVKPKKAETAARPSSAAPVKRRKPNAETCEAPPKKKAKVQESEADVDGMFEVERILMHRKNRGVTQYLVQWKGYDDTTWEPRESFVVGDEVHRAWIEYDKAHK